MSIRRKTKWLRIAHALNLLDAPAPIRISENVPYLPFSKLLRLEMDDPESPPPPPPPPLKRQNALWGKKLLEALNPKGHVD